MDIVRRRLLAITIFSLVMQLFVFRQGGSVAGILFFSLLWALTVALFGRYGNLKKRSIETYSGIGVLALTGMGLFIDGVFRQALIVLGVCGLLFYSVYALLRRYTPRSLVETFLSIPQVVGHYLSHGLQIVSGSFLEHFPIKKKTSQSRGWQRPLITGLAIGIPIAVWMTALLSSGDPIFGAFITKVFDPEFFKNLPVRILISVAIFVFLLPTAAMGFTKPFVSPLRYLTASPYGREAIVVLSLVSLVLGTFIVVEWPYVFASVAKETSLSQFGVATYSEYVKKGFGELVMVTGIVTFLTWIAMVIYHGERETGIKKWVGYLQTLIGIETLIFVISIARRVYLYTTYHGLSLARIYGMLFLIWLSGMGILALIRYIRARTRFPLEILWTIGMFMASILINTHALVVAYPPTVNGKTDYVYLSRLSADGYEGWKQAYTWAKDVIEREENKPGIIGRDQRREIDYAARIITALHVRYVDYVSEYDRNTSQSFLDRLYNWNYARMRTFQNMKEDMPRADIDSLLTRSNALLNRINRQPDGERTIDYDVSFDSPLL